MTFDIQNTEVISQLVHEKSGEILAEVGFCVPDSLTLNKLESAGFIVERDAQMVRIPAEILETALDNLPKNTTIFARNGRIPAPFDIRTCFMGAGTPVNVLDLESGIKRPATHLDVQQLVKIQDALPMVDIVRPTVTATDMGEYSDLIEIAELLRFTEKPVVHRVLSPDRVEAAVEMLAAVAGGEQVLKQHPNFATLYCPISPGYFTPENIGCMLRWAEFGIPITLLSMAMGGASAPVTLLGELIVINTDILAWIVALQVLYPGTPLLYGSVASVLDMRTGILPLGAPERGMINSGAAMMGNYYGIPSMCGGLSSDAKQLDAQAGAEKVLTAIPLLKEKASIIYGVGATDAGSSISYTQMVLDNEIIAGLRRLAQDFEDEDIDSVVELIKSNTPRGNFLKEDHTRRNYHQHWQPGIFNRDAYETWQEKGETIEDTCRERVLDILSTHETKPLPAEVESELEKILRRYYGPNFSLETNL
ncbi:MAG: trimethylamine methyltransferase family protein [Anaerolineales bacterium]